MTRPASPAISVIVPTHNRPSLLEEALRSVASQSFQDFEVIVVNDHPPSADAVATVVGGFDDRFEVLQNRANLGVSRSRHAGIDLAHSELLAPLDDDDLWLPGYLEAHVGAHAAAAVGVTYCGHVVVWPDGSLAPRAKPAPPPPDDVFRSMLAGRFVLASSSSWTMKRRSYDEAGGYDDQLDHFEDWDLLVRLAQVSRFGHIPQPLVHYRMHLGERVSNPLIRLERLGAVRAKWSSYAEIEEMTQEFAAQEYFNASRLHALRGERRKGLRYLWMYATKVARGAGEPGNLARLAVANVAGRKGYGLAQRTYRRLADRRAQ